jgi:hypothetical protein
MSRGPSGETAPDSPSDWRRGSALALASRTDRLIQQGQSTDRSFTVMELTAPVGCCCAMG